MPELIQDERVVTRERPRLSGNRARVRRRRGLFLAQAAGELLMTGGVIALLFVAWALWWTNVESNAAQSAAVQEFLQENAAPLPTQDTPPDEPSPVVGAGAPADAVPVTAQPAHGKAFGVLYIPRFGPDYSRPLVEGTSLDVLDTLGLGHYGATAMPGEIGNFAVAGHRQTHGAVLDAIHTLVPGDKIYVQTADGFYTYVSRNGEIVLPDRTDVLQPVPGEPGVAPEQRILTMTSCNPRFGSEERIIAYAVFDSWQPLSAGPPAEIAEQLSKLQGKG